MNTKLFVNLLSIGNRKYRKYLSISNYAHTFTVHTIIGVILSSLWISFIRSKSSLYAAEHLNSSSSDHTRPCYHKVLVFNSVSVHPRDNTSAGLACDFICPLSEQFVKDWILLTRFAKNDFHLLDCIAFQAKVRVESVQKNVCDMFTLITGKITFIRLDKSDAAQISSRGIGNTFTSEVRDFSHTYWDIMTHPSYIM